ncbi:uncharacterized protein BXZ73DRAFT_101503 [Epithele typhae]|uniref:uncharacterized protein n=1 Tax=Epithele typhae TaxID=378194 RepID=UPI002008B04C|nr:uncharacterized protein BXZ73DRAFT_101503 [Epithele typhae]KAH9932128.1 hypothetical protein BXZ73DRAFT_101503 [Epithele typhae]
MSNKGDFDQLVQRHQTLQDDTDLSRLNTNDLLVLADMWTNYVRRIYFAVNSRSGIEKLPAELILKIYEQAILPSNFSMRSLFATLHQDTEETVPTQSWRLLATTTPHLWSYIHASAWRYAPEDFFPTCLQRAGTSPLYISIFLGDPFTKAIVDPDIQSRLVSLRIMLSPDPMGSHVIQAPQLWDDFAEIFPLKAPRLQSLGVAFLAHCVVKPWGHRNRSIPAEASETFLPTAFPSQLRALAVSPGIKIPSGPFPKLTHLSLSFRDVPPPYEDHHLEELRALLASSLHLEFIFLRYNSAQNDCVCASDTNVESDPVSLPSLRAITIVRCDFNSARRLVDSIALPPNAHVHLILNLNRKLDPNSEWHAPQRPLFSTCTHLSLRLFHERFSILLDGPPLHSESMRPAGRLHIRNLSLQSRPRDLRGLPLASITSLRVAPTRDAATRGCMMLDTLLLFLARMPALDELALSFSDGAPLEGRHACPFQTFLLPLFEALDPRTPGPGVDALCPALRTVAVDLGDCPTGPADVAARWAALFEADFVRARAERSVRPIEALFAECRGPRELGGASEIRQWRWTYERPESVPSVCAVSSQRPDPLSGEEQSRELSGWVELGPWPPAQEFGASEWVQEDIDRVEAYLDAPQYVQHWKGVSTK